MDATFASPTGTLRRGLQLDAQAGDDEAEVMEGGLVLSRVTGTPLPRAPSSQRAPLLSIIEGSDVTIVEA